MLGSLHSRSRAGLVSHTSLLLHVANSLSRGGVEINDGFKNATLVNPT